MPPLLVESPGACSVQLQAGDNRLSFTERHGATLSGCRPTTFVRHAIQTASAVITDPSSRCPPVTVCNCWKPNFRCRRCSTMEHSATRILSRVTLYHGSRENLKHSSSASHIPLFGFSFFSSRFSLVILAVFFLLGTTLKSYVM